MKQKYDDYQHAIEDALAKPDLSLEDREMLEKIGGSLRRVQPLIDASRRAEEGSKFWAQRCSCPDFCYFHTPLAGAKK